MLSCSLNSAPQPVSHPYPQLSVCPPVLDLPRPTIRCSNLRSRRHRDEKPVTATPLDSALTKRDARNPFRIRFYENCRVVLVSLTKNLKILPKFSCTHRSLCLLFPLFAPRVFHNSFPFSMIRTLSKKCRVYPNSSHFGTLHSPTTLGTSITLLGTPKNASRIHFSFLSLARCRFLNSFLLIFMQIGGGCMGVRAMPFLKKNISEERKLKSGPQGQGKHLPVFWTSHQFPQAELDCRLDLSQSKAGS